MARHGLDEIVLAMRWFAPVRFLAHLNPWNWMRDRNETDGARIRHALEELGPIFVKFGQMLSTRPDLIPEDIAVELALLQDRVPAFSNAPQLIESLYGRPLTDMFYTFDNAPLASASIAQVHAATLLDGKDVVVKVLRPGIDKIIKRDISLLYTIASLAERYWFTGRRLKPRDIVREFEQTLLHELDLLREAANASQLKRNFLHSDLLHVPEIYWPLAREKVMVMERIHGIQISDIDQLRAHGIDLKQLAERGVEIFFTQVFRDCFFHADMHPGNIFVSPKPAEKPQYIAVDFGIMGTLSPTDQRYLAENILAFFNRDYRKVAQLHIDSNWVPPDTRVDELESAIRTVCEPIFERPLKDISFGQLLLRLFQTGKQFHMKVQPQLLLLQKTLIHIEGLGRQLYPDLDLWSTGKPYLERWLKQQVGFVGLFRKVKENIPFWLEKFPEVPELGYQALQYLQHQEIRQIKQADLESINFRKSEMKSSPFFMNIGFFMALVGLIMALVSNKPWEHPENMLSMGVSIIAAGVFFMVIHFLKSTRID